MPVKSPHFNGFNAAQKVGYGKPRNFFDAYMELWYTRNRVPSIYVNLEVFILKEGYQLYEVSLKGIREINILV